MHEHALTGPVPVFRRWDGKPLGEIRLHTCRKQLAECYTIFLSHYVSALTFKFSGAALPRPLERLVGRNLTISFCLEFQMVSALARAIVGSTNSIR